MDWRSILADKGMVAAATNIIGTYGPTGQEYTAVGCRVQTANTGVICWTAPGIGISHAWKFNITTPSMYAVSNFAISSPLSTGYMVPNITAVYLADAVSAWDWASNAMSTEGGADIILDGRDFGPVGTPVALTFRSTMSTLGTNYAATACVISVADTSLQCASAPGVGGGFDVPLAAFKLAHGSASVQTPPPRMGQHTDAVLAGLGTALFTGVLFGVLPARNAARLDPVEALRSE